jgi:hypothetical protein
MLTTVLIAGCAHEGPEIPLTYWHPTTVNETIPKLSKRIGELESERTALLAELGDKVNQVEYINSRFRMHRNLLHAEWELEQEIEKLKKLRFQVE